MDATVFSDILADPVNCEFSVPQEQCLPEPVARVASQPSSPNRWDPRLIVDLALAIDALPDILSRYQVTEKEYEVLSTVPAFRQELALVIRDIRENGLGFVAKAKVQAEAYLGVVDAMVYDQTVAPSTRLDAIKSVVTWGRLLPKEDKTQGPQTSAQQINVNISF